MSAAVQEGEYERDLAQYARVDWLYFGRCDRLHAVAEATYDATDWCLTDVTLACGRTTEHAWIPGIFSRMGIPRCAHCCDALSLPRGVGSPKNDDECRRILGLPTKEESANAAREVLP